MADKIGSAIVYLIALILSITVHEFGHAVVADRLGDSLPRRQGRVTLNPMAHIDPLGTIVMPLLIMFTGAPLLGWGRPVVTNPLAYTRKLRLKTGHMIVAAAGPTMNFLFAVLVSAILVLLIRTQAVGPRSPVLGNTVDLIRLNIILMFFNLIPLPPLDGGTVLAGLLPDQYTPFLRTLHQYGPFILMGLLLTGLLTYLLTPALMVFQGWMGIVARFVA